MGAGVGSVGALCHDESDLKDLRAGILGALAAGVFAVAFGVMALVAHNARAHPPEVLLVVLLLLAAAGASQLQHLGQAFATSLLVAGLCLAIVVGAFLYPGSHLVYAFTLVVIVASAVQGETGAFAAAFGTSLAVLIIDQTGWVMMPAGATATLIFLLWTTAILCWLASRPTRTTLDWAWHSYLLAQQRTDELRDRQGELARLAKSLNEACVRLEQMNGELERARRAAEEARRLKAEFAATISHELRTPLNLIIGFAEMMMGGARAYGGQVLQDGYRQDLEVIHRNACHISHLIDDVLDLSQIEAHRMALERRRTSAKQIVDEAVETVASLFTRLGLSLAADVPADLPMLYVDANRISQILINLLNNASRFTDHGGVTIRATCDEHDLILAVEDTGVGIAPEDLPNAFQEFHRAGPPGRRGGSGFGLAVCKRFAEMHGGHMWVESRLKVGSTFRLALPLCENVVSTAVRHAIVPPRAGARAVAVVDSEPDTARVFQRYLDGYEVVQAASIDDLGRLAGGRPLHALVLANPTQIEGMVRLETMAPHLRGLPVFTCSLSTRRVHARDLGVVEYLTKPVTQERLREALRRVGKAVHDVLIVEDEPEMVRLFERMVRRASPRSQVRKASNGADALALLRERRPDVVLLDLLLPRVSGYDVLREMKTDPDLRDVPVVVVSARGTGDETVRANALSLERDGGLTVGELMECLRRSLDALLDVTPPDSVPARRAGSAA